MFDIYINYMDFGRPTKIHIARIRAAPPLAQAYEPDKVSSLLAEDYHPRQNDASVE